MFECRIPMTGNAFAAKLLSLIVFLGSVGSVVLAQNPTAQLSPSVDTLEFGTRFDLYRYLQRGLEDYFDTGDSLQLARLWEASVFIRQRYSDDFYVRQCRKFQDWRNRLFANRNQLKSEFTHWTAPEKESGPLDLRYEELNELAGRFLSFGDSSAASVCWEHAAATAARVSDVVHARRLLGLGLNVSRLVGDRDGLARCYNLMGSLFYREGDMIHAGAYFDSARVLKAELDDISGVSDCLSNIASVYYSIGDKENSLRFAEQALRLRRELNNPALIAQSLLSMIPAFAREVAISSAESWLDEASQLTLSVNASTQPGQLQYCAAVIAELHGNLDSAQALYEQSLELSAGEDNSRLSLAVLQNLAALESALGRYDNAFAHYAAAQKLATATRNQIALATIFHNLGSLHQRLGNPTSAIEYYQRAVTKRQDINLEIQNVETLCNLADLYQSVGDTASATAFVRRAAQDAEQTGDDSQLASVLICRARLEQAQGNHDRAMADLHKIDSLGSNQLSMQRRIDVLCLSAELCRQSGDFANTLIYLARAYAVLDSCSTYSNRQRLDIISASLAMDENEWGKAHRLLSAVIARFERTRGNIPDPQLRSGYQSQSRHVFEMMVRTIANLKEADSTGEYDDSLLFYIERAKSRGTLDAMSGHSPRSRNAQESSLQSRERQLLQEINLLESSLTSERDIASLRRKLDQLERLENSLTDLRLQLSVTGAGANPVYSPRPISIKKLQSTLRDDRTALLTFLLMPAESYAILIEKKSCRVIEIASRSELTSAISNYARLTQLSVKDESLLDSLRAASIALGSMILPSGWFDPESYDKILISADGILSVLPFESLRFHDRFLIEYCSIAMIPSLFLFEGGSGIPQETVEINLLALADPRPDSRQRLLPFSVREVEWIEETIGKQQCTVLTAAAATKKALLDLNLKDFQIIHAATHTSIDYDDPSRSKIWLSADTVSGNLENYVTLDEVEDLRLDADLVVLSSCESGGGSLDVGEGMEGFVKAFMHAGARNILVSLWEVEDFTTAAFMRTFYQNLSSGYSSALRVAKIEMIKSPRVRHRHPYYWSPFVLTIGRVK